MNNDLTRQSHALFVRALDIDAPRRDEFVRSSCAGNAALETRVRKLIAAVDRSTGFLEVPALGTRHPGTESRPPLDPASIRIPGYRAIRVIGAGGMATVFEAEQDQPRRTVALKVMSRGLTSASAVRRFKYETEVLARLQHPGIASIYEAGTFSDRAGHPTPYFAMDLISGARTIVEHARQQRLSRHERLELFATVCDAVQHGHQLGVIHRDLKPGNILVDSTGRARVIDFGIARPTDPESADITERADAGQLIGTLNYMSPEQCAGGGGKAGIDVRSDVYSLGVVLYQLLASRLPHDLSRASIAEAARIITHETPTRLSTVAPDTRGDLESIVHAALEKDPARRYAGAGALAADIRRFLNHQPIEARAATTVYQLRMFAKRHRPLVIAASTAVCTLILGVFATTYLAIVASRARDAAELRERELEQVAAFQESQLSGINVRQMGERLRDSVIESARAWREKNADSPEEAEREGRELDRLLGGVNFTTLALRTLDENVIQRSRTAIDDQFADQPLLRARLLHRLAATMNTLGLNNRIEPILRDALRIRREELGDDDPDTMLSAHAMGSLLSLLGRHAEALAYLQDNYERRARVLGPDDSATLATGTSLGGVLRRLGRFDEAEQVWSNTLAALRRVKGEDHASTLRALNNMGVIYAVQGRFDEAEACWRDVVERRRRTLGEDNPDYQNSLSNLAGLLNEQGKLQEALPYTQQLLTFAQRQFGEDHADTLYAMVSLGTLLLDMGDIPAAESIQRDCLKRRTAKLGPTHSSTLLSMIAVVDVLMKKAEDSPTPALYLDEAEKLTRDALDMQRRTLGSDNPETIDSINKRAGVLRLAGRNDEALPLTVEAIDRGRRALPSGHWSVGEYLTQQGRVLTALSRWTDAETALLQGYAILNTARGASDRYTKETSTALAKLYEAWNAAAPDPACAAKAAEWRAR